VGQDEKQQLAMCPVSGGGCTALTKGDLPVWDSSESKIYFLRGGASVGHPLDLWSLDLKTHSEKQLAQVGPFLSLETFFDVSRSGQIVTTPFHEGRSELWLADMKR
jgi:hypothetical protein